MVSERKRRKQQATARHAADQRPLTTAEGHTQAAYQQSTDRQRKHEQTQEEFRTQKRLRPPDSAERLDTLKQPGARPRYKLTEGDYSVSKATVLYDDGGSEKMAEAFLEALSPLIEDLDDALDRLKERAPKHYEAIMLMDSGKEIDEIAAALGVGSSTVDVYVARAKDYLEGYVAGERSPRRR